MSFNCPSVSSASASRLRLRSAMPSTQAIVRISEKLERDDPNVMDSDDVTIVLI